MPESKHLRCSFIPKVGFSRHIKLNFCIKLFISSILYNRNYKGHYIVNRMNPPVSGGTSGYYTTQNAPNSSVCCSCDYSPPIAGLGERYVAPPAPLKKPPKYIQPWDGYVPNCTLKNRELCKYFPVQTFNIKAGDIYTGIEVKSNKWMDMACEEARKSVSLSGGPFGAVIVQVDDMTQEVLRYWVQHNYVPISKDPTAHAEMCALRTASRALGTFNLGRIYKYQSLLPQKGRTSHCELYSSCEPCPMCYSGIYLASIPVLYFAATRYDAAQQGVNFPDEQLYLDVNRRYPLRTIKCYQCTTSNSLDAFNLWKRSPDTHY